MTTLHNYLIRTSPRYRLWHQTKHHNKIHWGVFVVFTLLIFGTILRWTPITFAADTTAPIAPSGLTASAISSSQINLSWTASTDDVGVAGYKIYRNGQFVNSLNSLIYNDTGLTASTAYTYAVSAYDAAGNESGKSVSTSAATLVLSANPIDNLKPGEWYEVPNSKLRGTATCGGKHKDYQSCGPEDLAAGITEACYDTYAIYDFSHIMDGWNGGAFDSKRNRLLIWGGGHKGWAGNDIYAFDLDTLKWERVKDASCLQPSDFGSSELEISGYYPSDGSPRMRHTYNYIQYVPSIDRFCSFGGAGMTTSGQTNTARVDCFNFDTKQWEKMADTGSWGIGAFSAVDPVTGHAFARGNVCSACANLWEFDPIKNTWTLRTNGESNRNMYSVTASIDPVRRKFVAIGGGLSYVWDIGTSGMITRQTLTTTGATEIIGASRPGHEYDPVSDKFVAWSGGADVYTLDMDTLVWTKHAPASTNIIIPTAQNMNGTYGRFRYSPNKNVFVVVNSVDQNVYIYKLSQGGGIPIPIDTQSPSIPTNLTATAVSSSQINLSWTASTDDVGVSGYKIYRCQESACTPIMQAATSAVISYSDMQLLPSTTFGYAVSAFDAAGNESGKSNSVQTTTQQVGTLNPVVINGKRFYSGGKPYFPSTHFLMFPISSHVYFSHLISDANRQVMVNDIKVNGYNSIYLYTLNQGDYGGKSVTPYTDENALIGGAFNESKIQQWRMRLEGMINDGIRPIIWLFADDSIKISSASAVELKRYIQKMVSSFDDLPIMWVLGLEVDEYWSKTQSDELGVYLQSIANNPVGIHQRSGLTNYMDSLWVDFGVYQYGFSGTWVEIYNNALSKNIAIGNKPLIFAEYHVGQDTQAVSEGLGAAFAGVAGVGNGAPGGLDEFMETLPDGIISSRAGNLLNLTAANTVAEADMNTLNFYIKSQDLSLPSIPTNLAAAAISSSQINLSWAASTDNTGVTGYKIYRCQGTTCAPTTQIATLNTNSYSNTGLTDSTAYTYAVSAYDAAGNESGKSGSVSTTTPSLIDTTPPALSSGSPTGTLPLDATQTILSLTTDENATCKYGTTPNTAYSSITNTFTTTGGTSHSQNLTGLTNGTSYNYYVRCQDAAGNANLDDYSISFSVSSQAPTGLLIPITVEEPAGIARINEPITSGIPLPQGTQTTSWSLWDGNTEIPLQTAKLKGKTPWILLDFQTSVSANGKKTLTLKDTASTALSSKSINIIEDLSQITVDNKIIKAKLSKTNFNLFEEVYLDKNNDGVYSQAEQVATAQTDNIQIIDSATGQTFSGKGIPDKILWEYQGPMRSTLRVDGRFKNTSNQEFINYTTKITFYAGKSEVKIEHIMRNSYQPNERHVKIKSATLKLGTGVTPVKAARPGSVSWTNVGSDGAVFELVPAMLWNIDTAMNNGMVIPDLSYHGATLIADFSETLSVNEKTNLPSAVKTPLFAMAAPSWYSENAELTTSKFSTLEDEKNAYRKWGWTWTPYPGPYSDTLIYTDDQEPQDPLAKGPGRTITDYFVSSQIIVVHGDTESDDLWQHNLMYLRTGQRSYLDRATAWARYMKWENAFRTDGFDYAWDSGWEEAGALVSRPIISIPLTASDSSYLNSINKGRVDIRDWGADHLWGWGLLDYYYLTGDLDAIEAAKDIGEASKRIFGWKIPGSYSPPGGSTRGPARNFLLATRLYEVTQEQKWQDYMEHMAKIWLQSSTWDPRGMYDSADVRPIHIGFLNDALYRYYQVTGNPVVRDRLIAMAYWVKQYGLQSTYLYSGNYIKMDSPNPGDIWHTSLDDGNFAQFSPIHTNTFIDTLVRGYRLTGDASLLERAKLHWDRASKGRGGDPNFRTVGDNQVGRFMNNWFLKDGGLRRYYSENKGELTYGHLLFYDYVKAGITLDITPPAAPQNLVAAVFSLTQINLTWTASNDPETGISSYRTYRNGTFIGQSNTTSFADTGLNEGTVYTYKVSAVNGAGLESSKSIPASSTTLTDTIPPTIVLVSTSGSGDPTQVIVVFSKPVEQVSATNVANYSIDNGIAISGASLGSDLKTVTLTTNPHQDNITYTLTVNNIKDRAATPNTILANSQKTYTYLSKLIISDITTTSGRIYQAVDNGLISGALAYIDRTFTYSTVSASLLGSTYIKTANDDKSSTGTSFLSFTTNQNTSVYIAHDNRITTKPAWLQTFTDTGEDIITTDSTFSIFKKDFTQGQITLGGNEGAGWSMYTVILKPASGTPSTKFIIGDQVQITDNLNVRQTPSITGTLLGTQTLGSKGTIIGGPIQADNYTWWNVDYLNAPDGWSVEDYLVKSTTPPPVGTTAPTTPANLIAAAVSSSQINLTWTASTDDVGVTGYKIYRNGQLVNSLNSLIYNDTGLTASTAYTYAVLAYDAAGNESAKSSSVSAITLSQFKQADFNKDGVVNQLDFDILKQDFNRTDKPKSDLNQDGIVDSRDLGIMMGEWGK